MRIRPEICGAVPWKHFWMQLTAATASITTWTVSRTSGDLVPELFPGGKCEKSFSVHLL